MILQDCAFSLVQPTGKGCAAVRNPAPPVTSAVAQRVFALPVRTLPVQFSLYLFCTLVPIGLCQCMCQRMAGAAGIRAQQTLQISVKAKLSQEWEVHAACRFLLGLQVAPFGAQYLGALCSKQRTHGHAQAAKGPACVQVQHRPPIPKPSVFRVGCP